MLISLAVIMTYTIWECKKMMKGKPNPKKKN